ncbi:9db93328-245a-48bb-987a-703e27a3fd45 [Thermothielavioides terrestris]|uniref:9db93328-245a-48bb-987a-703e27a3fd45 n=1 Tax=Thermothielavioides terrestris TaxID=2587410 RepID=A0A446BV91_9PEZI|nr:9db93328-245a-48bb-987a-703e27a3fd45 [Thermothielavioides terrestris]
MADQPAPVVSEPLCEGDTTIITNVLPPDLAADAFERLLEEVSWAGMSHMGGEVPRRIAVQGAVAEDGSMPVYRHPADESPPLLPFSPTVLRIKEEVEKHLGHPVNHVLIQHYRTGNDYISEHSDKTLDIVPGSFIANVSLGAERTMVFRTKRPPKEDDDNNNDNHSAATTQQSPSAPATTTTPDSNDDGANQPPQPSKQPADNHPTAAAAARTTVRAPLPHNSLCRMGLATNARWLHAIRQDKRAERDKTAAELSHGGARISLTFRQIGTFIDGDSAQPQRIWGQGAVAKARADARPVVNGQTDEAARLLRAFGAENNRAAFDWRRWYGAGFDVLHMGTPKRWFASHVSSSASSSVNPNGSRGGGEGAIANTRVALALAELGVGCARGSVEGAPVRFEDNNNYSNDPGRRPAAVAGAPVVVEGHASVLRYLDAVYGPGRRCDQMPPAEVARRVVRLERALDLLGRWTAVLGEAGLSVRDGSGSGGGGGGGGGGDEGAASKEQTETVVRLLGDELAVWDGWAAEEAAAATPTTTTTAAAAAAAMPTSAGGDSKSPSKTGSDAAASSNSASFFIAGGSQPSPADFALWPVLHDMVAVCGSGVLDSHHHLARYYAAFGARSAVAKALAVPGALQPRGQAQTQAQAKAESE